MEMASSGESWVDGLDWTPVEVGNHASSKVPRFSIFVFFRKDLEFLIAVLLFSKLRILRHLDCRGRGGAWCTRETGFCCHQRRLLKRFVFLHVLFFLLERGVLLCLVFKSEVCDGIIDFGAHCVFMSVGEMPTVLRG